MSGFEIAPADFYFVQGVNPWQAECLNWQADETKTVYASWGDNLSGDAKLKVNMPIRVELGLETTDFAAMDGFAVVKLEPSELDRNSAYGTFATPDGAGGFYATATSYTSLRVFDPGVTFSVQNVATGDYVVQPGVPPTAEINATGKVVYGYNLRVPDKGDYEITFVVPGVTISAVNRGTFNSVVGGPDTASLTINVVAAGGGGGGGGKGGGKGGGQGG
ncbi:MAG TPA: hypothetical protein VLA36_12870 [Longimicrobiales bacterium]|nr:hypothetical protein [Longimicrobiales bacterium]